MPDALDHRARAERIVSRCRELAAITDVPGQTTRTFLSPATRVAQARLTEWMQAAGMEVNLDRIGNLHGMLPGSDSQPTLLIGSHLDTVVNAGAFDGLLGVLLGIELVEASGPLPFAIEVIAFSEEEGVRFGRPFLGSLALIGEPAPLTLKDSEGITLGEAIQVYGHQPSAPDLLSPAVFGYLEFHIEQGLVLESEQRPLAAVAAISGQTRLRMQFQGQANHAGATPMHLRRDALAAAAEWIVAVEAHALAQAGLVATVGSIQAIPGLGNVIAGECSATLDLRHPHDGVRQSALRAILDAAHQSVTRRGVSCSIEPLLDQPAVPMDQALTAALVEAAASCGYDASPIASGAGHDAMILARRVPSAMLFLRTPAGLSHHPNESVGTEDVEAALAVSLAFLRGLEPVVHNFAESRQTHA